MDVAGLREAKPAEQLCVVGATVTIGAARKSTQTNVCESTWDLSALATSLETAYAAEGHVEYWSAECDSVLTRLNRLEHQLSDRYAEPFLLGVGVSGIAIRLTDRLLSQQFVALKFPRPVPGRADLLGSLMDKEIGHLAKLRHSAVVRLHTSGTLGNKAESCGRFPYYVMDFISGNKSITYFESQQVDDLSFIQIVQKTATAIAYLHDNGVAHLDIKPDNILITADGEPVLSDLGTAKALGDLAGQTIVACTYAYADPELLKTLDKDPSDKNRARGNVRRRDIDRKWDLFSFGKTLLHWLGFDPLDKQGKETFRTLHLQPYTRKYILLLAARLLHGDIDTWLEDRIGLDRRLLKQLSYADATRVLLDLRKLSGDYSIVDAVPELNVFYPRTLQVASDGPIPFS